MSQMLKIAVKLAALLALVLVPASVFAGEGNVTLPPFDRSVNIALYLVLVSALIALAYGAYLIRKVLSQEQGTAKMIEVAKAIQEGARAYLTQQMRVLAGFIVLLSIIIFLVYLNVYKMEDGSTNWSLVWGISVAFFLGACLSALGWFRPLPVTRVVFAGLFPALLINY